MPHVGIHGLRARECQKGGAEHCESDAVFRVTEVENGMMGAICGRIAGALHDALEAEQGNYEEPYEHHRPEDVADELSSLALHQE
jgi:hypothetical protein